MPALTLPYTFVNGTIADATQVDANFNALLAGINTNTRTILTTNITFFVSSTGSDTNTGLDPALPAATATHCLTQLYASYDLNGFQAMIQYANGAYSETIVITGGFVGQFRAGQVLIQGNVGSPDSVVLQGSPCLILNHYGQCQIQGFNLTSNASDCLQCFNRSDLGIQAIDFGSAIGGAHIRALRMGQVRSVGNYTISGGAINHLKIDEGQVYLDTQPYAAPSGLPIINLIGTPNFSGSFASISKLGILQSFAAFTGSGATGIRHDGHSNAVFSTGGAVEATYFPGNLPGTRDTGAQWV